MNVSLTSGFYINYQNLEIKQFTEVALSLIIGERCRSFYIPAVPLPAILSKNISPGALSDAPAIATGTF